MLHQSDQGGKISGKELGAFLERHRRAMVDSGLFNFGEMRRIERMRDTLARVEKQIARGRRVQDVLDESPDAITDLAARIVGANLGSMTATAKTGAPLVAAGAGSRFVRRLTNKIPFERTRDVLAEAVLDRNVMRDLLERVPNLPKSKELTRRTNAWLANLIPPDERKKTDPVVKPNGAPYQTRKAAEFAAKGRKLKGHTAVEVEGGWGLMPPDEEDQQ
jgi:hypothetical protein